jgi:hypothetical protein
MEGINRQFLKSIAGKIRLDFADFSDSQAKPVFGYTRQALPVADDVYMSKVHR